MPTPTPSPYLNPDDPYISGGRFEDTRYRYVTTLSGADLDGKGSDNDLPSGLRRRVSPYLAAIMLVATIGLAVGRILSIPSPYYLVGPGPALSIPTRMSGVATTTHQISYTTVESTRLNWGRYLWLHDVQGSHNIVIAASGPKAQSADTVQQMNEAKTTASELAQYLVTGTSPYVANGAIVESLKPNQPGELAGLAVGDVITAAGLADSSTAPTSTPTPTVLLATLSALPPGAIALTVQRNGATVHVSVKPPSPGGAYRLGVSLTPSTVLEAAPTNLDINTTGVEGPSGGLMFTIAYLDALSPGDLTGGHSLAGTGTIAINGEVGPIGSVQYKVEGARNSGAKVFFVPTTNYPEALTALKPGMALVPVHSVSDALRWLCGHGATDQVCQELPTVQQRLQAVGGQ